MSEIEERLGKLQPFLIGIRYLNGTALVDAVFKEGWTIPDDPNVKKVRGNEEQNYYMLFSEIPGIGLDELLVFVDKTIKINIEREKKQELLVTMVNELKIIFKQNTLSKLKTLKFEFKEDLINDIEQFDLKLEEELPTIPIVENYSVTFNEEIPSSFVDENGKPIEEFEPTEEDLEMIAEEARAEKNRLYLESKKNKSKTIFNKVELPPKKKVQVPVSEYNYETECDCGEEEACHLCIDKK